MPQAKLRKARTPYRADVASFTIILATAGRETIKHTLASIAPQLEPGDELYVLHDDSGDAGDTPRNQTMHRARGSHLLFMDDDDVYVPDALARIRRFADENPGRIGLFKMKHVVGTTHWHERAIYYGNVSTQTFCIPNVPGKLGRWHRTQRPNRTELYIGDYVFLKETIELQGEPIFVDEVTVLVRPERNPVKRWIVRARYRAAVGQRLRSLRAGRA
jgi:glycosyltransferase involved in cell wall biosynthesis